MSRKVLAAVLVLGALVALPLPGRASSDQIADSAGDHPVPFMDITGVGLGLTSAKGAQFLRVTFTLAGAVSPESRATQTGYSFTATVGKCDLLVRFVGYPDDVVDAAGFATTRCGADGKDVGGTFKIQDNTVTVLSPLRDLKGVTPGLTMTDLGAYTSPVEGMYHDETTAPSAAGDAASSDKPWVIG
jgi:hypothetical protein